LRALSDQYKRIAGYSIEDLATAPAPSATQDLSNNGGRG
jgi:hypothetical protein